MFLLIAIIDGVLITMLLFFTLSLPIPWINQRIAPNLQPFVLLEKKAINNYIVENWLDSIDINKKYYVFYDKNNDKVILKEWEGKMKVWALWFFLWTQSYWNTYYIKFSKITPLTYETIFNHGKKLIKIKWH